MQPITSPADLAQLDGCLVKSIRLLENPVRLELTLETRSEQQVQVIIVPHLITTTSGVSVTVF